MPRGKKACGGKPQKGRDRGRHKHRFSAETEKWNEGHLPPKRPPWMDEATYQKLLKKREG